MALSVWCTKLSHPTSITKSNTMQTSSAPSEQDQDNYPNYSTKSTLQTPCNMSEPNTTQICDICADEFATTQFVQLSCSHKFCRDCVTSYANISTKESRVCPPCPNPQCGKELSQKDIENILGRDSETYKKWERFQMRQALMGDKYARLCPTEGCDYAVLADNCQKCPKLTCELCQTEFCFHCRQVWHDGKCSVTNKFAPPNDNYKGCPRCNVYIEKKFGCNEMKCTACGFRFCWFCGQGVSPGGSHFIGAGSCPMFGEKKKPRWKLMILQIYLCICLLPLLPAVAIIVIFVGFFVIILCAACRTSKSSRLANTKWKCPAVILVIILAIPVAFIAAPIIGLVIVAAGFLIICIILPFALFAPRNVQPLNWVLDPPASTRDNPDQDEVTSLRELSH